MMDSETRLDSALFQLTPTRTRFDLVLFRGNKNEKLASGLFDPFVSHLKFARDQIAKGGYSISLRPPGNDASWFTKATFERFVRFVNTPAIIERFVSLEKEILQIGHSIQANESRNANGSVKPEEGSNLRKPSDSSKLRSGCGKNEEDIQEENSKLQLQRLFETRKTLLHREQAMAYARGVVAGFEMDSLDGLISFADAFGASRLREACINYKELWMKKHGDGIWMAELAAVQACSPSDMPLLGSSGIVLANEMNGLSSNGPESSMSNASLPDSKKDGNLPASESAAAKFQAPMPWPNQMPPYFYNFGGSIQPMPPYQGYPFPPMHPGPHQYLGYMQLSPKGKSSNKKGSESSESCEFDTESNDSASSLEDQEKSHSKNRKDHHLSRKKNRKKSSKTVIIRNINYITPEGRKEDLENDNDELVDQVSAVALSSKGTKHDSDNDLVESGLEVRRSSGNWDTFQNLLMRDEEAEKSHSIDIGEEQFALRNSAVGAKSENIQMKGKVSSDFFILTGRSGENEVRAKFEDFENGGSVHKFSRKTGSRENNMLLPARSELIGDESNNVLFANEANGPIIKSGRGEDWFVANHDTINQSKTFDGDFILSSEGIGKPETDKSKKETFVDDSFMVQQPLQANDDVYDSRLIPDQSIVADLENRPAKTQQENCEAVDAAEPNDLFMVLKSNSGSAEYSWDLDYEAEFFIAEANGRRESSQSNQEDENNSSKGEKTGTLKNGRKDVRSKLSNGSLGKNRAEILSRSTKKPSLASRTITQKSKLENEEEMRKRMEELAIQRQKRIAERTAAATARRVSMDGKTAKGPISTSDKNRTNRTTPVRVMAT